ncbi:MAG: hypothetical protein GC178_14360 [Flavobacteriales bacterium]|nr:hypothetical protein [Flavobacteriales bacterium]
MKLFLFRQMALATLMLLAWLPSNAQLVDGILGQRRDMVQVLLRPYRIIDYQKDREVHNVEVGIHQTALFEDDTCRKFYWAVTPERIDYFKGMLAGKGYRQNEAGQFVLDSLELTLKELPSGKATLFIASISENLKGKRDASGALVKEKKKEMSTMEEMPRLQQAILAEERDTTKHKEPKDPERHWVGGKYGNTTILGWEK